MAAYTTIIAQDPFPRSTTPRAGPTSVHIITKRTSYQSLISPVLTGPVTNLPSSPISPDWPAIKVTSPSTASHHSLSWDQNEGDGSRSPRLALLTGGLLDEFEEINKLISPFTPIPQSGDELLYDVMSEEKPNMPLFNSDFQASLERTKKEMKDVALAIWGCPASHQLGSNLYTLRQRAQQLGAFEPVRTKRIALVGDTGAGKSGLLNALLDQSGLVFGGYDNDHFASVVTEYCFRPTHYSEPFGIDVDYLTTEEIRELIQELLKSFHAGYDTALLDIASFEEQANMRYKADKAWYTLYVMFRSQKFFTKDFLLRYPTNAQTPLIDVLHHWAVDFLATRSSGGEARMWSTAAFDIDECSDKLSAFTGSPIGERTPALWPFVRLARVYLRSPILQSGIVLVDCPTLRGLDYARARTIDRYLRSCHEVLIVTPREQAVSDGCIADVVGRIGRHRPLSIICTKTDDISVREMERTDPDVSLQIRTWRKQVETLRMQAKRSEARRRHDFASALQEEARTRDLLEEMEFGLKQFLVARRNGQVANLLIEKHAVQVQKGDLKVFCVSSHDYWKHRYDEQERAVSRLDLSGIVNLRGYCHSVAASVQFEEASTFIEHDVPAFLGSLKQWAIGGTEEITTGHLEEIRQTIKNLEAVAIDKLIMPKAQIHTARASLDAKFASAILLPIREHQSYWRNAAIEVSKQWTKWNAKDYIAFCRYHGNHTTEATGHRIWNEELIHPMRHQLETNWQAFQVLVETSEKELTHYGEQVFDEICTFLREHLPSASASFTTLLASIPHRKATVNYLIHIIFASLLEATQSLETDTIYGHLSSIINTLMTPAYHTASALSATTPAARSSPVTSPHSPSPSFLDQQRKDVITSHIASARIFPRLSSMVEKAHREIVREAFHDLHDGVGREVDALLRDLHMAAQEESEAGAYGDFAEGLRDRIVGWEVVVGEVGDVAREVRRMYSVDE